MEKQEQEQRQEEVRNCDFLAVMLLVILIHIGIMASPLVADLIIVTIAVSVSSSAMRPLRPEHILCTPQRFWTHLVLALVGIAASSIFTAIGLLCWYLYDRQALWWDFSAFVPCLVPVTVTDPPRRPLPLSLAGAIPGVRESEKSSFLALQDRSTSPQHPPVEPRFVPLFFNKFGREVDRYRRRAALYWLFWAWAFVLGVSAASLSSWMIARLFCP